MLLEESLDLFNTAGTHEFIQINPPFPTTCPLVVWPNVDQPHTYVDDQRVHSLSNHLQKRLLRFEFSGWHKLQKLFYKHGWTGRRNIIGVGAHDNHSTFKTDKPRLRFRLLFVMLNRQDFQRTKSGESKKD